MVDRTKPGSATPLGKKVASMAPRQAEARTSVRGVKGKTVGRMTIDRTMLGRATMFGKRSIRLPCTKTLGAAGGAVMAEVAVLAVAVAMVVTVATVVTTREMSAATMILIVGIGTSMTTAVTVTAAVAAAAAAEIRTTSTTTAGRIHAAAMSAAMSAATHLPAVEVKQCGGHNSAPMRVAVAVAAAVGLIRPGEARAVEMTRGG